MALLRALLSPLIHSVIAVIARLEKWKSNHFTYSNKAAWLFPVALGIERSQSLPWPTRPKCLSNSVLQTHWTPEPLVSLWFLSADSLSSRVPGFLLVPNACVAQGLHTFCFLHFFPLLQQLIPIPPSTQASNANSLARLFSPFLMDQGMFPCYFWEKHPKLPPWSL